MGEWKHTMCTICAQCCGIEAYVEDGVITRIRGDESSPRSEGHICRKGRNMTNLVYSQDRLEYPLKKVNGEFVRISWDQAMDEISAKISQVLKDHGPRALGVHNACHFSDITGAAVSYNIFLALVGCQNYFTDLAAELTGLWWSCGKMMGNQGFWIHPDIENSDVAVCCAWNPLQSNQTTNGKRVVYEIASNPDKTLIVIDPKKTETARMADYHLKIRPGTDMVLWRAMLALVLQEKWYDQEYIDKYVTGFEDIFKWVEDVDVRKFVEFCDLDYDTVYKVTEIMAKGKTSIHKELGNICGRHSTLLTHVQHVFSVITGKYFVPGGMIYGVQPYYPMPHTDNPEEDWHLAATGFRRICAMMPTAALSEEINNDSDDRIRVLLVGNSNPVKSIVDQTATEEAFKKLEMLVVCEAQMTDTAKMADYVLPHTVTPEMYGWCSLNCNFPGVFASVHPPIIKPYGESREPADFWIMLMQRMNLIPPLPQSLYDAAKRSRVEWLGELMKLLGEHPELAPLAPIISAYTLGPALGSYTLAILYSGLYFGTEHARECFARMGYAPGPLQGEQIFQTLMEHPEGAIVGMTEYEDYFRYLETDDKKIHVYIDELDDWMQEITPEMEAKLLDNEEYPLMCKTGKHFEGTFNFTMQDRRWNTGKNFQFAEINPADAADRGIKEGDVIEVYTNKGSVTIPAHLTTDMKKGHVMIPHGVNLSSRDMQEKYEVNRLTDTQYRDRIAGTPFLANVLCNMRLAEEA